MTLPRSPAPPYVPRTCPTAWSPGLEETTFYDPENFVFPFGAHACIVDVDVGDREGSTSSATSRSTTAARRSTRS
jgi:CO/xanthine dehydrogenase Mo-binding subunit